MPITREQIDDAAKTADVAVVFIGRAMGESLDNRPKKGYYYLTDNEKRLLDLVTAAFSKTAVVIDAGNIIDMAWVREYGDRIDAVLRRLVEKGLGLECNTAKGGSPRLPEGDILRRYRELGGEIITLGSDAHTPDAVGAGIRETQELLRECGFRYVCAFREKKPVFHNL
jgi:histidinol phosphatase-like PHP family hydrolase